MKSRGPRRQARSTTGTSEIASANYQRNEHDTDACTADIECCRLKEDYVVSLVCCDSESPALELTNNKIIHADVTLARNLLAFKAVVCVLMYRQMLD